jgi:hypothetical protein
MINDQASRARVVVGDEVMIEAACDEREKMFLGWYGIYGM